MSLISENINGNEITAKFKSSNLNESVYNVETKKLKITFNNGSIYEYDDVDHRVFAQLRLSTSQGKYFNKNINGKYKHKKISK